MFIITFVEELIFDLEIENLKSFKVVLRRFQWFLVQESKLGRYV